MANFYSEIAEYCGEAATDRLIEVFGGQMIHVPRKWNEESPFAACGEEHGKAVIEMFAGERLTIPRFRHAGPARTKLIKRLLREGLPANAIAEQAQCTNRYVFIVKARSDGTSLSRFNVSGRVRQIIALTTQGLTVDAIAQQVRCQKAWVVAVQSRIEDANSVSRLLK